MGGYGATFLGLKHFNEFAALGTFSGAVAFAHEPRPVVDRTPEAQKRMQDMQALFGKDDAERKERDPFALLEKVPAAQMPRIYIACGGEDFLIKQNREFVQYLADRKVPYEYREISPRVHAWDFWDDEIRIFLDILDTLPGFQQH
jgi:S-formylglutathione hydrolase FrmB